MNLGENFSEHYPGRKTLGKHHIFREVFLLYSSTDYRTFYLCNPGQKTVGKFFGKFGIFMTFSWSENTRKISCFPDVFLMFSDPENTSMPTVPRVLMTSHEPHDMKIYHVPLFPSLFGRTMQVCKFTSQAPRMRCFSFYGICFNDPIIRTQLFLGLHSSVGQNLIAIPILPP